MIYLSYYFAYFFIMALGLGGTLLLWGLFKKRPAKKLSATQLARRRGTSARDVQQQLIDRGFIQVKNGTHFFTSAGRWAGGEFRKKHATASDSDGHMVWPTEILSSFKE